VFSFDRRVLPEEDLEEVIKEFTSCLMKSAKRASARCRVEVLSAVPPSTTPPNALIVRLAKECLSKMGYSPRIVIKSGRTDAVYYVTHLGSEAVCLGPGVDGMAHAFDEFTEVDQVASFITIYKLMLDAFRRYVLRQ